MIMTKEELSKLSYEELNKLQKKLRKEIDILQKEKKYNVETHLPLIKTSLNIELMKVEKGMEELSMLSNEELNQLDKTLKKEFTILINGKNPDPERYTYLMDKLTSIETFKNNKKLEELSKLSNEELNQLQKTLEKELENLKKEKNYDSEKSFSLTMKLIDIKRAKRKKTNNFRWES